MHPHLEERWVRLWRQLGRKDDNNIRRQFASIVSRYSEPHRAYHTLGHLVHCFREFDEAQEVMEVQEPLALEFGLWFHDYIYWPKRNDNERRSASKAEHVALLYCCGLKFSETVSSMILDTRHSAVPELSCPDSALLLDIDLAILGQPTAVFDRYEQQIRHEYGWVTEEAYCSGRTRVLKGFLDRSWIYLTPYYRTKYEAAARENLSRSIALLSV